MTRRHSASGNRFVHEVAPGYQHQSRSAGRWEQRRRRYSRFEIILSAYCIIATIGVIAASIQLSEPPAASEAIAPASSHPATPVEARRGNPHDFRQ